MLTRNSAVQTTEGLKTEDSLDDETCGDVVERLVDVRKVVEGDEPVEWETAAVIETDQLWNHQRRHRVALDNAMERLPDRKSRRIHDRARVIIERDEPEVPERGERTDPGIEVLCATAGVEDKF